MDNLLALIMKKNTIFISYIIALALVTLSFASSQKDEKKIKILLVGDSTTIGSMPREVNPKGPHLEQMIEEFALIEGLPKLEVVNVGKGGETAKRLLGSKWYKEKIASVEEVDYIFLRMGINDWFRYEDFKLEFPIAMKKLITQLKKDHPKAIIILSTICQFMPEPDCEEVNGAITAITNDLKLQLFDLYTPYNQFLKENGLNTLNVRQPYLSNIPDEYHDFLKPYTYYRKGWGNKPSGNVVKVNDMSLDPLFGHIKGWYDDRHPNSTGYRLIAYETVKYLKRLSEAK